MLKWSCIGVAVMLAVWGSIVVPSQAETKSAGIEVQYQIPEQALASYTGSDGCDTKCPSAVNAGLCSGREWDCQGKTPNNEPKDDGDPCIVCTTMFVGHVKCIPKDGYSCTDKLRAGECGKIRNGTCDGGVCSNLEDSDDDCDRWRCTSS